MAESSRALPQGGPVRFQSKCVETDVTDLSHDDSLLVCCLSWAEAGRIGLYREYMKRTTGTPRQGNYVPRSNRVRLYNREVRQGDVVTATCWFAVVGKRSHEVHCELKCNNNVFARVECVRVNIGGVVDNSEVANMLVKDDVGKPLDPIEKNEEVVHVRTVRMRTRQSDCDALGHISMTCYPQILMTAFWNDENNPIQLVDRFDIDYDVEIMPDMDVDLVVSRSTTSENVQYVLIKDPSTGKVYTRSRFEFAPGTSVCRYDWANLPRPSKMMRQVAVSQVDKKGPFRTSFLVAFEYTSTSSAFSKFIVKWTEAALYPVTLQMAAKAQRSTLGVTTLTRAMRVHVLKRPTSGTVIFADCHVSKFGKSSIEFSVRFHDSETKEDLFYTYLTKVQVDNVKRKPSELFFDVKHFADNYFGLQSPVIPLPRPFNVERLHKRYTFSPSLRHQDFNLDRHVSSHYFMIFVHDAYIAWQQESTPSEHTNSGTMIERIHRKSYSDSWVSSFGLDYIGEIVVGDHVQMNIFSDGERLLWFTFEVEGVTRCRVWAITDNSLPEFDWLVMIKPEYYLKPHRVEGVDETQWGPVVVSSTTSRSNL